MFVYLKFIFQGMGYLQALLAFQLTPPYAGLDISTHPPLMAGNFNGGQVKFDKYQPGWQAPFFLQKSSRSLLWAG